MIAITGHTSGIGKAIADLYTYKGHRVLGFSRSTGYDLADIDTVERIADAAKDADIFINNAYRRVAQVDMLYAMHKRWKNDHKTIVSISSNSGDGIKSFPHPYAVFKSALDKAIEQLQVQSICRVMNLRPGYVDTERVKHIEAKKLSPDYVANIVAWMIEQNCLIKTLTIEP